MKTKYIKLQVLLILVGLFNISMQSQNNRSTLKDKLRFVYVANPNNSTSVTLDNTAIHGGTETGSFWRNNNMRRGQALVRALLRDNANGGDRTLQYFAAKIVKIIDKPILVYLYDDVTNSITTAARNQWGMCPDNPGSPNAKAWPCANNQSLADDFAQNIARCLGNPDPGRTDNNWGGYMHMGAHHMNANQVAWTKGTFIHELVHTQDISDNRMHMFWVNGSNFRYGLDGTHYGIEAVPNLAMTYKEGIANTITLLYDNAKATEMFTWFKDNEALLVEINPNPTNTGPGNVHRCLDVTHPSPDAWLYTQMRAAGHREVRTVNVPRGSTNQYAIFRIRDVEPKFIIHNEYILALIFSEYARHISLGRFITALKRSNNQLFRVCASGIAVLFENMCNEGIPAGETLGSLSQSQSGVTIKKYLLPLAYADYFTGYRSQTKDDFKEIFENALPEGWIDLYWNTGKDTVRNAVPLNSISQGNLTDIAIALGINQSDLNE
ncbi:hypothetical protein [Tenacibaculum xiamenense]|uniref:hypothetical protein n=1 Tax=Tenacibaculum xiamenense TaxID=1261553 RepID=UPI0038953C47